MVYDCVTFGNLCSVSTMTGGWLVAGGAGPGMGNGKPSLPNFETYYIWSSFKKQSFDDEFVTFTCYLEVQWSITLCSHITAFRCSWLMTRSLHSRSGCGRSTTWALHGTCQRCQGTWLCGTSHIHSHQSRIRRWILRPTFGKKQTAPTSSNGRGGSRNILRIVLLGCGICGCLWACPPHVQRLRAMREVGEDLWNWRLETCQPLGKGVLPIAFHAKPWKTWKNTAVVEKTCWLSMYPLDLQGM